MRNFLKFIFFSIVLLICINSVISLNCEGNSRFLHITDLHLDNYYTPQSSIFEDCHRGTGDAGTFGTRGYCDSPMNLVSAVVSSAYSTVSVPRFVIWTGDNARHDADSAIPRTANEIFLENERVYNKVKSAFPQIPLIPSIGNNDVYPHDQLCLGPNDVLSNLSSIWKSEIPQSQQFTFSQIGSFFVKIDQNFIVVSLNTIYFYKKNGCGGCHSGQPGYFVFNWLEDILSNNAGYKVLLTGHVPPIHTFWHKKCIENYINLLQKYPNVITGHYYGHTHTDEFVIFRDDVGQPLAVINVAPSGIPSYNPSFRYYTYNCSNSQVLDYHQFYADVKQANRQGQIGFNLEYTWTSAYGYPQLRLSYWDDLENRIQNDPTTNSQYTFYRYVSSGVSKMARNVEC